MKKMMSAFLALALVLALAVPTASAAGTGLTLQKKYTVADYKEESWGTPPMAVDLDGDGKMEVLHGAYTLTVADGATGQIKWQVNSGKDRSTPYVDYGNIAQMMVCKFIVKDFNGDGKNEIALGYANGSISLLNNQGYFMPGFPVSIPGTRVQALAADDVDGDGKVELIAGVSGKSTANIYVYGCDGQLKPGWPQLNGGLNAGYSFDIYSDGIATGDLDGDRLPEIVVPLDNGFVAAYNGDGTHVMVGSKFEASQQDSFSFGGGIPWNAVSFYEDYSEELRRSNGGFGLSTQWESLEQKGRKGTYKGYNTYAAVRFADVDKDGTQEVLVTNTMFDATASYLDPTNINCFSINHVQYPALYVLNGDRTRMNQNGCNWENIPTNLTNPALGKPLNQNPVGGDGYTRQTDGGVHSVPVVGDINGDGVNEILFNSFDGKVHCYSAKNGGKEVAGWPYTLPGNSSGTYFEFPAEPTLADLNGDGKQEVVVVSWTETESSKHPAIPPTGQNGSIYVLDGSGKLLIQQKLEPMITYDNVSHSKPVVADVDGDKQMEILISSSDYGGLVVYDVVGGAATQTPAQPTNPTQPAQKLADARDQKVVINGGEPIVLHAFGLKDANGNYTNYVSVRDLAWVMNGGSGAFDVAWDSTAKAINLVTGKNYSNPTGNEGKAVFTGSQPYNQDPVKILVDGKEVKLELINIGNGNTYYKLRDLGSALGIFDVGWDQAAGAVTITTK